MRSRGITSAAERRASGAERPLGERRLLQERVEIERSVRHRHAALRVAGPFAFGTVAIELDAVVVRIAKIDRFAHAVIARALEWNARGDQATQCVGERRA